jgi:hypothetical protein
VLVSIFELVITHRRDTEGAEKKPKIVHRKGAKDAKNDTGKNPSPYMGDVQYIQAGIFALLCFALSTLFYLCCVLCAFAVILFFFISLCPLRLCGESTDQYR